MAFNYGLNNSLFTGAGSWCFASVKTTNPGNEVLNTSPLNTNEACALSSSIDLYPTGANNATTLVSGWLASGLLALTSASIFLHKSTIFNLKSSFIATKLG